MTLSPRAIRPPAALALGLALLACLAMSVAALGIGAVKIAPAQVLSGIFGWPDTELSEAMQAVVWNVRLPRVAQGLCAGAALAVCGVMLQALFRNPLADPALIGVSAGAALGAVATIVLGATWMHGLSRLLGLWTLPAAAFAGALCMTAVVFSLARREGVTDPTTMLLCGIAVNALSGAGIGLLTYLATDDQLRNLTFWSLGSLGTSTWGSLAGVGPALLLVAIFTPALARPLNALLLGESEALHLGVPVERIKRIVIILSAAGAGAIVAVNGVIGFIGLIAPHTARLIVGPDHRVVLPLSALLGATLLTAGDLIARTAVKPAELPIGVLTALLGAPFFLWLLRHRRPTT